MTPLERSVAAAAPCTRGRFRVKSRGRRPHVLRVVIVDLDADSAPVLAAIIPGARAVPGGTVPDWRVTVTHRHARALLAEVLDELDLPTQAAIVAVLERLDAVHAARTARPRIRQHPL